MMIHKTKVRCCFYISRSIYKCGCAYVSTSDSWASAKISHKIISYSISKEQMTDDSYSKGYSFFGCSSVSISSSGGKTKSISRQPLIEFLEL